MDLLLPSCVTLNNILKFSEAVKSVWYLSHILMLKFKFNVLVSVQSMIYDTTVLLLHKGKDKLFHYPETPNEQYIYPQIGMLWENMKGFFYDKLKWVTGLFFIKVEKFYRVRSSTFFK